MVQVEARIEDVGVQVGNRIYSTAEDATSVDDIFVSV